MRKVKLYIAMSLDGYIAKNNDSVDFLRGDDSDKDNFGSYPDFISSVDTVILGYKTYEQITNVLSVDKWPYEDKKSIVLTSKKLMNTTNISFVNEDLTLLINQLKATEGKNIWICGGASIINQLHQLNLIDEYIISIIPTILGNGIKLFNEFDFEQRLKLKETKTYNGIVDLVYIK